MLRQSSSVSFQLLSGSVLRASKRSRCAFSERCIQNFTSTMPSLARLRSNETISSYARRHSGLLANPSTRSTRTRPYHDRSSTAMPPHPGSSGQNRQRK